MANWIDRLENNMPDLFISVQIQALMLLTAHIFRRKSRCILFQPVEQALQNYAEYTRDLMQQSPVTDALQNRMYTKSFQVGQFLRGVSRLRCTEHLTRLVFLLYRNIGIEMRGSLPGTVEIHRCYFAGCYTPQMCRQIASMDAGIVCGLFDGGEFQFVQRMTEGCAVCKAFLKAERGECDEN